MASPNGKMVKANRRSKTRRASQFVFKLELSPQITECPPNIWSTLSRARKQQDLYTILMSRDDVLASSASGVLATVYANDPSVTSAWSSIAAVFDEFRVLAFRVIYRPHRYDGGTLGTVRAAVAVVTDYDTPTALTGYLLANQFSSCKEYNGGTNFEYAAFMSGSENSGFISTGSPSPSFWVKLYSAGNSTSTSLGHAMAEYVVQFRGKGI